MNKPMFFVGISMMTIEILGILLYVAYEAQIDISSIIIASCLGLFNFVGLVFMIVGAVQTGEQQ